MRKSRKNIFVLRFCFALAAGAPVVLKAQEPNFSQFIASPLSINPALAGSSDADWRGVSNIRRQWIGNISPYSTQTISIDGKLKTLKDQSYFGIGGISISERAFSGTRIWHCKTKKSAIDTGKGGKVVWNMYGNWQGGAQHSGDFVKTIWGHARLHPHTAKASKK